LLEEAGPDGEVERAGTPALSGADEHELRLVPAEQLAAELQRRGWVVVQP
jgi:hypothetical protein